MSSYKGRTTGQLAKQIDHKRRRLVRNNLACWLMVYRSLDEAIERSGI